MPVKMSINIPGGQKKRAQKHLASNMQNYRYKLIKLSSIIAKWRSRRLH